MSIDAKEAWAKLNERVSLSYYIGQPAVDAIAAKVLGAKIPATQTTHSDSPDVASKSSSNKAVTTKK
jgi:hypothetical protein